MSKPESPNPEAIKAALLQQVGAAPKNTVPSEAVFATLHHRKRAKWWLVEKSMKRK